LLVRAQLITHPGRQFGWASGRSERQMKLQVKLRKTFVSLCFNLKIRIDFTLWDGEVQLPRSHSRRFDQAHGGLGWTAFRPGLGVVTEYMCQGASRSSFNSSSRSEPGATRAAEGVRVQWAGLGFCAAAAPISARKSGQARRIPAYADAVASPSRVCGRTSAAAMRSLTCL